MAFAKLDKTGNGMVEQNDLASAYDVTQHPKFISGEMTKADILNEFMAQWDTGKKMGRLP